MFRKLFFITEIEEFSFDAYYLIIFSSRNWRAIKPWSVYFDINLLCLSGRKRIFRKYI